MNKTFFQNNTNPRRGWCIDRCKTKALSRYQFNCIRFAMILLAMLQGSVLYASTTIAPCDQLVGNFASLEGSVFIQRTGNPGWHAASLDTKLCENDAVRVAKSSRAAVSLINKAVLRLKQNTTIRLTNIFEKPEKKSFLEIIQGVIQSISRQPHKFAINTPYLNGSIEGTEFLVEVDTEKTTLTVLEGIVLTSNDHGSVRLKSGESAYAKSGSAPVHSLVVNPRNAVQWAMYYPPVLAAFGGKTMAQKHHIPDFIQQAVALSNEGRIDRALELFETVPIEQRDEIYFSYRAFMHLSIGLLNAAEENIQQALKHQPNDSNVLAIQTIIAISRNENEKALSIAQRATQLAPDSVAALIALSYAQQSMFNIKGARSSLKKAVKLEPDNALAWARLASLHSVFQEYDLTFAAAEKAVQLAPDLSLSHTVLGFAHLIHVDTFRAKLAFSKAIEMSQADPLPRIGIGLAKIREGDLEAGGRDIEIAVNLDPNRAIFRSYLGKTYYEQKRSTKVVDQEFVTAKQLDPRDPTPYLYSAIQKQTTNRPVEALKDAEKAIELNDNRAIYRSKLSLDQDLAARSAATARIYSDLGFQQLALVEGWKSVNTDPGNFSAHRFLADSYSVLPRHEIARVSELLQSQLLQPINMTPIQPRLSESNLHLISAGGPGSQSFNEFNPLFNSNGLTFQGSGVYGGNDTYAGEGMVSGIYDKASFSLGYSHFDTDGWRKNNAQDDDIANAFVQYELSPQTSIQAEYRYRNTKNGAIQMLFNPDDFSENLKEEEETHLARFGFRHDFSQASTLIGNFSYQDSERHTKDQPIPIVDTKLDGQDTAFGSELQHLFKMDKFSLVSGVGYFNIDSEDKLNLTIDPPVVDPAPFIVTPPCAVFIGPFCAFQPPPFTVDPPPFDPPAVTTNSSVDRDVEHTNAYIYSHLDLLENLTVTLGGSGDFFDSDQAGSTSSDQFNPKFGITWNPLPDTLIRGAAFRVLKRTLITDQTLEPTQVAGFNQFFDDFNATDSWRYGVAVDQKFGKQIYAGAEYSYRDLDVPYVNGLTLKAESADWHENIARAYIFWAPLDFMSLNIEYQWEKINRDRGFSDGAEQAETHRVPLGVNFFHPSGFGASVKATYIKQHGSFERLSAGTFENGSDDFVTVDASLSYRLPKRYGFISVGASNLFNQKFNYFDTDRDNPSIQPEQFLYSRITLSF